MGARTHTIKIAIDWYLRTKVLISRIVGLLILFSKNIITSAYGGLTRVLVVF